MPVPTRGAQRASVQRFLAIPVALATAAAVAAGALGAMPQGVGAASLASPDTIAPSTMSPSPAPSVFPDPAIGAPAGTSPAPSTAPASSPDASGGTTAPLAEPAARPVAPKVVVVVGPVGGKTSQYRARARILAARARAYGARVVEVYSPNATWARVRAVASGANILIYLGHGNGWPSGHGPFNPATENGLGLNALAGRGNANTTYYGESIVARSLDLAPGAVVILNHLCYASGNNEWGRGNPRLATAIARVDNYGAGFLRAGAAAVIADGLGSPDYVLRGLLRTNRTIRQIFWSSASASHSRVVAFASRRTRGASALMDPYAPGRYYRSVIGDLEFRATAWR